jgi:predicted nucleotide-binding protein
MATRYLFVSYARSDAEKVLPVVEAVRREYRRREVDVDVWVDIDKLTPGQRWDKEITRVLENSVGLLVFISPAAIQSEWVQREVIAAATQADRLILPIILHHVPKLPLALEHLQWLDLSQQHSQPDLFRAATQIADATERHLKSNRAASPVTAEEAPAIAATIAQDARNANLPEIGKGQRPDSVFLVHGHDTVAISDMDAYLSTLGVKTVVLSRVGGQAPSLLEKFLRFAKNAQFAVVILSADDLGASRIQYEADGVGDRAIQFRARQNVILELGFFYGLLGWENVFVLYKPADRIFPNFERPSDLEGAVFDLMDASGEWRESLAHKLAEAGFSLTKR